MKRFHAYIGNFLLGARLAWNDRTDLFSTLLIYTTLMTVFNAIYSVFPLQELGHPDLTHGHLLWYFAITEIVIVSVQGSERELGRLIAEGQITTLIQRPLSLIGLTQTRMLGYVCVNAGVLILFALLTVPFLTGLAIPMPVEALPLLVLSILLGIILFLMLGYAVCTIEIFGPYSRPVGWILNKIIFTFGGLFFPVMFFPELLQKITWLTPFPAIITVLGNFVLVQDMHIHLIGIGHQLVWLLVLCGVAKLAEYKMIQTVLTRGD